MFIKATCKNRIKATCKNRIEELENIDLNLIDDMFKKDISKEELRDILEKLFLQKVSYQEVNTIYNNLNNISKKEFRKQYLNNRKSGIFTTIMYLGLKVK